MELHKRFAQLHDAAIRNVWLRRLTTATRVLLAIGFIPPGLKKIVGERFTLLGIETDVGFFFEGLYRSGFYYQFIGWAQVLAGVLLLVPRTATLGALLYFPLIVNIFVITVSMHFRGTWIITGLLLLANLYLLCWDYDKFGGITGFGRADLHKIE